MIKKKISRTMFQKDLIDFVRDEIYEAAIKDDGIYSTFEFHSKRFTTGEIRINLRYCKFDGNDCWIPMQKKIFYKTCPELKNTWLTLPRISPEMLQKATDRIKIDMVKKDNALWSTIEVEPCYDHFAVSYEKAYADNDKDKVYVDYSVFEDMNVTLMVVPEGMNKDFVNKVKANYQSNNSLRLFIASTDIDYSCEHEPIKTKYDLFEKWIKTGYVDIVYFMLGFEKDPDVRAFEAFVRGITEFSGKVDVRVAYQRDDILNDANNLRTAYFDEADAKEDLEKAGNKVVKEAKTMQDIYGLDDEGLEAIRNSRGQITASEELVIGKIMDVAFAEDEDAKPVKKGGKK